MFSRFFWWETKRNVKISSCNTGDISRVFMRKTPLWKHNSFCYIISTLASLLTCLLIALNVYLLNCIDTSYYTAICQNCYISQINIPKHIKATHFSQDYENTMLVCILLLLLLYAAKEMSPCGGYEVPLSSCFESALKPIHQTEAPEMWSLFK